MSRARWRRWWLAWKREVGMPASLVARVQALEAQMAELEAQLDQISEEVEAIERTLGANPQGPYPTVRDRVERVETITSFLRRVGAVRRGQASS